MATPSLQNSIAKLTIAGEQAGFTVEQMIWLLNAGVTIEGLLRLIEWRLDSPMEPLRTMSLGCVNPPFYLAVMRRGICCPLNFVPSLYMGALS